MLDCDKAIHVFRFEWCWRSEGTGECATVMFTDQTIATDDTSDSLTPKLVTYPWQVNQMYCYITHAECICSDPKLKVKLCTAMLLK